MCKVQLSEARKHQRKRSFCGNADGCWVMTLLLAAFIRVFPPAPPKKKKKRQRTPLLQLLWLKLGSQERGTAGAVCVGFCLHRSFCFPASRRKRVTEAGMEGTSPIQLSESQDRSLPSCSPFFSVLQHAFFCAYCSFSGERGRNPADKSSIHGVAVINSLNTDSFSAQKVLWP